MKTWTPISLLLILPALCIAQKTIYIPNEWQGGSFDYSLDRSAESDNFIIFWGPLAGNDPTQAPTDIAFNPASILNTAEDLYRFYIDTIKFVDDDHGGLITQYKIILVMLHTWPNYEGWAFGGNYDGQVGAMWMHPHAASSGPTLAHEFTHTLQNYTWMMNPGHGFIDSSYVGFFWETHAEFMAMQRYPSVAREFDMARWLNTAHFHWSSTRHHYQAFIFLQYLKEKHGIGLINRLWNESIIGEHPLQTYKRLTGISQEELNQRFVEYAMRNVTWDYDIQEDLRIRMETLPRQFVKHETIIPTLINSVRQWYEIPNHLAPQDYGYNVIRLYPEMQPNCSEQFVYVQVEEQAVLPNHDAMRVAYGLVAVDANGNARYSEIYYEDEVIFEVMDTDTAIFMVVVGAPQIHHNYRYEIGFPKIHRQPYSFRLQYAKPEGYQAGFNAPPNGIAGAPHSNGGGFVATSATVDKSAFVGPNALVLDNAQVRDNAIINGYAVIKQNALVSANAQVDNYAIIGEDARISGSAVVSDGAHVFGNSYVRDSARIEGNTLIFFTEAYEDAVLSDNTFCWGANLHGDVRLGGDAEFFSECSDGTYMQVDFAYDRFCDGLDIHPANKDLQEYVFAAKQQGYYALVCDTLLPNILETVYAAICEGDTFFINGIPITDDLDTTLYYSHISGVDSVVNVTVDVINPLHAHLFGESCQFDTTWWEGVPLVPGVLYDSLFIASPGGCGTYISGMVDIITVDTSILVTDNKLEVVEPALFIQWYDCETNMPVPNAFGKTFTPAESGSYKAFIFSLDSCEAFSGCHFVLGTGIEDQWQEVNWSVFPNPASDQLNVVVQDGSSTAFTISIIDALGRIIVSDKKFHYGNASVDVSFLSVGPYSLQIRGSDGRGSQKRFVKFAP
jgi:carbonic anhydrase/acetyltransferase-like protein (isoleucine patch superfamily)